MSTWLVTIDEQRQELRLGEESKAVASTNLLLPFFELREVLRSQVAAHGTGPLENESPPKLVVPNALARAYISLGAAAPWQEVEVQGSAEVFDERGPEAIDKDEAQAFIQETVAQDAGQSAQEKAPIAPTPHVQVPTLQVGLPPKMPFGDLLFEVRKLASWHGRNHPLTRTAIERAESHPEAARSHGKIDEAILRGLTVTREIENILQIAKVHGNESRQVQAGIDNASLSMPWINFRKQVWKQLDRQAARYNRAACTTSVLQASEVDHRIQSQKSSKSWTLLIDEGGNIPDSNLDLGNQARGKFVGLLVPKPSPLPNLERGWHAIEKSNPHEIDRVVQSALDSPVGIFGLDLSSLPRGYTDPWLVGVLQIVHWICRLVPLDGPTEIEVLVEQRGVFVSELSWAAAAGEVMRHLADLNPQRYAEIKLTLRLIKKEGSLLNGYVDALAFTWISQAQASIQRLKYSELQGPCLQEGTADLLQKAWDRVGRGQRIEAQTWQDLVASRDAVRPESMVGIMLAQTREACKTDESYWEDLLSVSQSHLESKAVDLLALGKELDFLEGARPPHRTLTPILRLAWLCARLEMSNHSGQVFDCLCSDVKKLGDELFDEVPTLVCQADLLRAVLSTNAFDFDAASSALKRWTELPVAVPGLQHWARVQSSLGQHLAFRGDPSGAQEHFIRAINAFARLSDSSLAKAETSHTGSYLAICLMDDPLVRPETLRTSVNEIAKLDLASIANFACSDNAGEKYAHHLLLRYLVSRGSEDEIASYLDQIAHWKTAFGHPWQLIEAYRGLLLWNAGENQEADDRLRSAIDLACTAGFGPTVMFIGLTISGLRSRLGLSHYWPGPTVNELRVQLPLAPWKQLEVAALPGCTMSPLELMSTCLPFNFR